MLRDQQGRLHPLDVQIKEQLQGLPVGCAAAPGATDHSRRRALANAWHLGIAKLLLHLVLVGMCQAHGPDAGPGRRLVGPRPEATGAYPTTALRWRLPPTRPLEAAASLFRKSGTPFGPPPPRQRAPVTINVMAEHLHYAWRSVHP